MSCKSLVIRSSFAPRRRLASFAVLFLLRLSLYLGRDKRPRFIIPRCIIFCFVVAGAPSYNMNRPLSHTHAIKLRVLYACVRALALSHESPSLGTDMREYIRELIEFTLRCIIQFSTYLRERAIFCTQFTRTDKRLRAARAVIRRK